MGRPSRVVTGRVRFWLEIGGHRFPIRRDVTAVHPDEVHRALGTRSETALQAHLDRTSVHDWYAADGEWKGRDSAGLAAAWVDDEAALYRLVTVDGDVTHLSLAAFLRDNEELRGEVEGAIRALAVGETYRDGGGAQPIWTITRVL